MSGPACCPEYAGRRGRPYSSHYFIWHEPDGSPDLNLTSRLGGLPSSEAECALTVQQMVDEAGGGMLYAARTDRWLAWDGTVYAPQDITWGDRMIQWIAGAMRQAFETVWDIEGSLIAQLPQNEQKQASDRAKARWNRQSALWVRLWSEAGQSSLGKQLARRCGIDDEQLDTYTGEIILDNCRISYAQVLRDGYVEKLPHDRRLLNSRRMRRGVSYDPDARAPWFELLLKTSVADQGQRDWLCWRTINTLFGNIPKKGFVNAIGERDSGKSTFTAIIAWLGGGYAKSVPVETFLAKHAGDQGFQQHELMGARFVHTHEPRPGALYDMGFMKRLTGREDTMSTRTLYSRAVEWLPQCTPFIGSNGPIRFNTSDDAFMERQEVIRFARGYERPDPDLMAKLKAELPGIINVLLSYALREARWGVPSVPQSAVDERERLADETEDSLAFIAEWIAEGRLTVKHDVPAYRCAQVGPLYTQFQMWCETQGIAHPPNLKIFAEVVGRRYRKSRSGGKWHFSGLVVQ